MVPSVAWVITHIAILVRKNGGLKATFAKHPGVLIAFVLAFIFNMASDDLLIPVPGFPMPFAPALTIAMFLLGGLMCRLVVLCQKDELLLPGDGLDASTNRN